MASMGKIQVQVPSVYAVSHSPSESTLCKASDFLKSNREGKAEKSDTFLWIASVLRDKMNQIFREVIHDIL
jgi:hypothetical protein